MKGTAIYKNQGIDLTVIGHHLQCQKNDCVRIIMTFVLYEKKSYMFSKLFVLYTTDYELMDDDDDDDD